MTNAVDPAAPVTEGSAVTLFSEATGKYCGAVLVDGAMQMLCNITDPAQATPLTIINGALSMGGVPLVSSSAGQPAVFSNTTSGTSTSTSFALVVPERECLPCAATAATAVLTKTAKQDGAVDPAHALPLPPQPLRHRLARRHQPRALP
jgi:hypothetical protein